MASESGGMSKAKPPTGAKVLIASKHTAFQRRSGITYSMFVPFAGFLPRVIVGRGQEKGEGARSRDSVQAQRGEN